MTAPSSPRTIGYLRVSTLDQAHHGVSLDAQQSQVRRWAEFHQRGEVLFFTDSQSGKRADNRPGLQRALAALGRGDALVVYSLSRLARSTKDALSIAEDIERRGADLVSLSEQIDTTSAAGKMVFRMLAVLAEFERDQLSERTSGALRHIRASGRKTGGRVPYGYNLDADGRTLLPDPTEQGVLRRIRSLRSEGKSLRAIAALLDSEGIRSKSGGSWSPKVIFGLLKRDDSEVPETAPAAA